MPRAALFLDFENLYNALKQRTVGKTPFGLSPHLEFGHLVAYIEAHYGTLSKEDFIAVANFTHYNPQIGGLNRVATVIDAQSFQNREAKQQQFGRDKGKRFVIHNYADMRLAFEVGQHVATRPADVYILGSGDDAFIAVARTLRQRGFDVLFLAGDPRTVSLNIQLEFPILDFSETQPPPEAEEETQPQATASETTPRDVAEALAGLVGQLRRRFSTAIPVALLEALLGPKEAAFAIRRAQGAGKIDLWESPAGVPCISLQSERLYGQVQTMESRPALVAVSRLLLAVREIAAQAPSGAGRPYWRRALREHLGLSNRQAKALLGQLLALGVLVDGEMTAPKITLETVEALLRQPLPLPPSERV